LRRRYDKKRFNTMKYFSIFTGVGGFELGIEQAYENIKNRETTFSKNNLRYKGNIPNNERRTRRCYSYIGYSEIDKYCNQLLQIKWPKVKNYGDATKINPNELPDFDLLVGGFPCQSFSIAGKRKGFNDTRGTLFFDVARILAHKKPKNVVLENVKGLLSHDGGRTFQTIIGVLTDLGYFVEWQVLNSKNFGVPQNRERVFIVGHLGGQPRSKVFPVGESSEKTIKLQGQQVGAITARRGTAKSDGDYIVKSVRATQVKQLNQPTHSNDRVYGKSGISPTLNTMQGGRRQPKIMAVLTPDREKKRQNGRRFKNDGEPSFTLTGQDIHGVSDGVKIRRLTPLETERLQGFPDNFTAGFSDTQRYKMMGNAVTVNVVEYVISRLYR